MRLQADVLQLDGVGDLREVVVLDPASGIGLGANCCAIGSDVCLLLASSQGVSTL